MGKTPTAEKLAERKQLARIPSELIKKDKNIVEYLEMEHVFIKKTEVDVGLYTIESI